MLFDNIRRLRRPESDHAAPGRRWKTNWPAEITSPAGRIACTVLDISSWGAQLKFEDAPEQHERVWLVIDGMGTIAANVVWLRDSTMGVQFVEQQSWIRRLHAQRLDPATWPAANT